MRWKGKIEMTLIGIDIGTSFIKGALLDLERLRLEHIQRVPFPEPVRGLPPLFREYDPKAVLEAVSSLIKDLAAATEEAGDACEGLVMCSQMHGLVWTSETGQPLSNLVTWQDQRGLAPHPSGAGTYFDVLSQRISPDERRQMGNELRPGLPIVQLFWLAEQGKLPSGESIPAALPDFVLANLCQAEPVTEITNAMSHGLCNLESLQWHADVTDRIGLVGKCLPVIVPQGTVVGQLKVGGRSIPCFTPIGDYQAAVLGALLKEDELSLNISTGSQVSLLRPGLEFGDFQTRPFFDGQFLSCITHIPAGWSLDLLVKLLSELAEAQQVRLADPWEYITRAASAVTSTRLEVDLAFFTSSCGDHGQIGNIHEDELTVGHLFRGAFQNMADNYLASALRISPQSRNSADREWDRLVFSGGLAQKIPVLRQIICDEFQVDFRMSPTSEETLLGLLALGLAFSGRVRSVGQAVRLLEDEYGQRS
jgi:sugar (pentulose or hexulose) kinase